MPYSESQHRLFCACANDPELAKRHGISVEDARRMCEEGVRKNKVKVAEAMMRGKG
jgi:hypothetical protein